MSFFHPKYIFVIFGLTKTCIEQKRFKSIFVLKIFLCYVVFSVYALCLFVCISVCLHLFSFLSISALRTVFLSFLYPPETSFQLFGQVWSSTILRFKIFFSLSLFFTWFQVISQHLMPFVNRYSEKKFSWDLIWNRDMIHILKHSHGGLNWRREDDK